jgi:hypothetical protein
LAVETASINRRGWFPGFGEQMSAPTRLPCLCDAPHGVTVHALQCPRHVAQPSTEDPSSRRHIVRVQTKRRWRRVDRLVCWAFSAGANPQAVRGSPWALSGHEVVGDARDVTVRATGGEGGPVPDRSDERIGDRAQVIALVHALGRYDLGLKSLPVKRWDPFGPIQRLVVVRSSQGWSYDDCVAELDMAREGQPPCAPEDRERLEAAGERVPPCRRSKLHDLHRMGLERLGRWFVARGLLYRADG